MNILITGATGLIGSELCKKLSSLGHNIFIISRNAKKAKLTIPSSYHVIEGNLEKNIINDSRLNNIHAVIHLAGENIAGHRWTKAQKEKILKSRSVGTKNLLDSLAKADLKVVISSSASGFYGNRKDEWLNEDSLPGDDFLAKVCKEWEEPVQNAINNPLYSNCRFVIMRLGMVLASQGGALEKMLLPFRSGFGAILGDGKQWISWIHLNDLINLYIQAVMDEKIEGIINAVSPNPVTNKEFSKIFAKSLGSFVFMKMPGLVLKGLLGEMAEMLLNSARLENKKLRNTNFKYEHPDITDALKIP